MLVVDPAYDREGEGDQRAEGHKGVHVCGEVEGELKSLFVNVTTKVCGEGEGKKELDPHHPRCHQMHHADDQQRKGKGGGED